MVFSFVGFKTEIKQVQFFNPDSVHYKVSLRRANVELEDIEVLTEQAHEWEKNLDLFKQEFIGTTRFAEKTVIINPEVLNFDWNDQHTVFTASADQEIHIINHALGYEIFITLKKFIIKKLQLFNNYHYRDIVFYVCYPRFKEMEAIYVTDRVKWIKNRREAYEGSKRHFMYSLYHNSLSNEAFDIEHGSIDQISAKKKEYLMLYNLINPEYKKKLKGFHYEIYPNKTNGMVISYGWDTESYLLPGKTNIFFIDEYGNLWNKKSFLTDGDWYNNRIAVALPLNYTPAKKNN